MVLRQPRKLWGVPLYRTRGICFCFSGKGATEACLQMKQFFCMKSIDLGVPLRHSKGKGWENSTTDT